MLLAMYKKVEIVCFTTKSNMMILFIIELVKTKN